MVYTSRVTTVTAAVVQGAGKSFACHVPVPGIWIFRYNGLPVGLTAFTVMTHAVKMVSPLVSRVGVPARTTFE
jgi:hypothetical protein